MLGTAQQLYRIMFLNLQHVCEVDIILIFQMRTLMLKEIE